MKHTASIDWTQAPEGANGWQILYGQPAWVSVDIDRISVQTLADQFERYVEGQRVIHVVDPAPLFGYTGEEAESFAPMPLWGRAPPEEVIKGLSYEQLRALRIMRDQPEMEGSEIARLADCSWQELFDQAQRGLTEAGMDRIEPFRVHPRITAKGRATIAAAEHLSVIGGKP